MAELFQGLDGNAYQSRAGTNAVHILGETANQHDDHAEFGCPAAKGQADGLNDIQPRGTGGLLGRENFAQTKDERQHHHHDAGGKEYRLRRVLFEYEAGNPGHHNDGNEKT